MDCVLVRLLFFFFNDPATPDIYTPPLPAALPICSQAATSAENIRFQAHYDQQQWKASETAVIVCDMWDAHHCLNATQRGAEMAPRMNEVLKKARESGSTIIHAPSSCMEFYKDHPARARAQETAKSESLPNGIEKWLNWINAEEEKAGYPIDHYDGGEDDEAEAHAAWAKELSRRGRNSGAPWIRPRCVRRCNWSAALTFRRWLGWRTCGRLM